MEGKDGKTELATEKKRSEERSQGNVCISPEVVSCCVLFCGLIGVRIMVPQMYEQVTAHMKDMFSFRWVGDWTGVKVQGWMTNICMLTGWILLPVFAGVALGTVSGSMIQTRPYFSTKAFKFKLTELNPVKGFKQLFSMQSLVSLATSILKVGLILFVAYKVAGGQESVLSTLSQMDCGLSLRWALMLIFKLSFWVVFLFIAIALIDWVYRKRQYEKSIMMTKQEIKDEMKQTEVNPLVRRALGKKMRELSLLRMMSAVPNANVIITNPTHVAIALQYDPETMNAPRVVAKGLRLVAQRIKTIARQHNIPVIEKPELARAIYKSVKVGKEIPSKFYEAVAAVLAYLHKIGRGVGRAAPSYAKASKGRERSEDRGRMGEDHRQ